MEVKNDVIYCESGWEKLYKPVINKILEYDSKQKSTKDKIGIEKVDAEYGLLHIKCYRLVNAPEDIVNDIHKAKKESVYTCECCGSTEHVGFITNTNIHHITCCERCFNLILKPTVSSSAKWMERTKR